MFRPRGTVVEAGGQKVFNAAPPDIGGNPVRLSLVYIAQKTLPPHPSNQLILPNVTTVKLFSWLTVNKQPCRLLLLILLAVYKSETTFR